MGRFEYSLINLDHFILYFTDILLIRYKLDLGDLLDQFLLGFGGFGQSLILYWNIQDPLMIIYILYYKTP